MFRIRTVLLVGAVALGSPSAFAACTAGAPIFADEFTDTLGGWDADDHFTIADGAGTALIAKGRSNFFELNNAFLVRDAVVCATVVFPAADKVGKAASGDANVPASGIMFAAKDYKNFFALLVSSTGKFLFTRYTDGQWNNMTPWTVSPAVKTGYGVENQVEVVLKGGVATLLVNGQKVTASRIQMPDGQSKFGFYAQLDEPASPDAGVPFQIAHFVVNQPPS